MHISFSPQRRDDTLVVSKSGNALTINGDSFHFSVLPDGATIVGENSPSPWIVGPIKRVDGTLHLTLLLPHGPNPSASVAFPQPIIEPADGLIALPNDSKPEPEDEDDLDA